VSAQDVGDAAIEAFDHAVGLRSSGLDKPMLDVVVGADPIEGVGTGWLALGGGAEAIGKFLAVVGEDRGDVERGLVDQALEETAGGGG